MSIQDRDWYKNSGNSSAHKNKKGLRFPSWLIFLLIVLGLSFYSSKHPTDSFFRNPMSNSTYSKFKQIDKVFHGVNNALSAISEQHKISYSNRDKEVYRQSLLAGINACNESKIQLESINPPAALNEIHLTAMLYLDNTNIALKNYLDSTITDDNKMSQLGNQYLEMSNQNRKTYRTKMIKYFEENDIKYEIFEDGTIRYWFKNSPPEFNPGN